MDDRRDFLEAQLEWTKQQKLLYDQLEMLLEEMKEIAEEAADEDVTDHERKRLQRIFAEKQEEAAALSSKIGGSFH